MGLFSLGMFGRRKQPTPEAPEAPRRPDPPVPAPAPGERSRLGRQVRDFLLGTDEQIDEVLEAERRARSAEEIAARCKKDAYWWPGEH